MKFDPKRLYDLIVREPELEAPSIGGPIDMPLAETTRKGMRGPVKVGLAVIAVFVVGLGLWAAVAPIWGAVTAAGVVRVEANRKTLKSRDGGIIRQINVQEGQAVKAGQLLIKFDDTGARAQVTILENQYDTVAMSAARLEAENARRPLMVPPELASRRADPRVAALIQNETIVYETRKAAIEGQAAILNQRFEQLRTARSGLQIQVDSMDQQLVLMNEELNGYKTLSAKGLAPKAVLLRLERQIAEAQGRRGALIAEVTRNQQQAGETRLQLASIYEQRGAEVASNLREAQTKLSDLGPRLNAAREALIQTEIRSPVDGYVLGLSQYTIGGVAGSGEVLMDVVPSNTPLVISAQIKPGDIDQVHPGMRADVTLQAYNSYHVPKIPAEVMTVSADAVANAQTHESYFRADLRIKPEELAKLPKGVKLYPGMQATVMIRTDKRTVLSFLIGPIGEVIDRSMREQ
ncbi:HlyD family type I secretion periplasmic adaptor subunit [Caulobacter segnis]|uniref:HlyD family type I secretion periplasmic adaptor subunit n=1 Tax=Caulobacter segnis TaxID=88688 RepID=UPI0028568854|nr:HlyD family type I secretion periplasmic adaptor subunit [Caulobacter segnis]MDR6628000.1 HlyD family secretion protein/epimerase transport system membrane fusion protein [Caulobacter segnis]